MAQYQMNYGFTKDGQAEPTRPSEEIEPQKNAESEHSDPKKSAKEIKKPQWFEHDSEKSTKVYVSLLPDGAPDDDWNEDEFVKFMSKCGVLDIGKKNFLWQFHEIFPILYLAQCWIDYYPDLKLFFPFLP